MASFDAAQLILVNFDELSLNWLHMAFDDKNLQIVHNMASNGSVCPHLVNGDHVWSRM